MAFARELYGCARVRARLLVGRKHGFRDLVFLSTAVIAMFTIRLRAFSLEDLLASDKKARY